MIVLISGRMGSGKTTLATNLANIWKQTPGNRAVLIKFADPLYDMHNFILGYLKDHGVTRPIVKDGALLQLLGTQWARQTVDENLWVKLLKAKIAKAKDPSRTLGQNQMFIIDDCRFKNEFDAFDDDDAIKVRLECPREIRKERCEQWRENDLHESEVDLDEYSLQNKFHLTLQTADMSPVEAAKTVMLFVHQYQERNR